jgi:sarcosine oxidase subunit alpha
MTESHRLGEATTAPVRFTFDGRQLTGRQGDTLASALLANGIRIVARSFKYHRPRGIFAAGCEEPNAIVAVGSGNRLDTNTQATRVPLIEGLEARSLNSWPSLRWDFGGVYGWFGRWLPAGFYYKTFFWPNWRTFEPAIRRAAGLGVAPRAPDPDRYERPHLHCDLLIIGSGPAGLAAALMAGRSGADTVLCEQDADFGGCLRWEDSQVDGLPAVSWVDRVVAELRALPNVRLMAGCSVSAYHDHNLLLASEVTTSPRPAVAERLWHIRAGQTILATGAIERPLVFPDNDRPGIMLASAVRHYLRRYRVGVGRRVAIATNNDDAYRTAHALKSEGIAVVAIIDSRASGGFDTVCDAPVIRGAVVTGTRGRQGLASISVAHLAGGPVQTIRCDALAVSGGWSPSVQLFSQAQGRLRFDESIAAFVPDHCSQAVHCAGAVTGGFGLSECLASGRAAAEAALAALDLKAAGGTPATAAPESPYAIEPIWRTPDRLARSGKQWIDHHNDVTAEDVALAAREGLGSVEHLKRYTTLGMAPDQGKTSNVNGLAILGDYTGRTPGAVGTTTFRPPYSPIKFGAIAGRERGAHFRPARRLPTHALQHEHRAVMEDYGAWLRPSHYPLDAEDLQAAITREVRAVREASGILDYSPLGKIEVVGPDAMNFLNAMVATNLATLKVGRARYSLTLTDAGVICDDGIITRLAEHRFLMGTTSGAVERIHAMFDERRQRDFPTLDVHLVNVTSHVAVLMISGPKARELLRRTGTDIDLSTAAFPHMSCRAGTLVGVAVRINRVSFTGEISYEISIAARHASALWQRLFALGADLGLTPIGIEALDVLRLEKGFIHVGGDTDGTSVPDDAGYGAMVRNKKADFVGRPMLAILDRLEQPRLQLVGVRPLDAGACLGVGAQIVETGVVNPGSGLGHVTSSAWSPTLNTPIALATLSGGRSRVGHRMRVWHQGAFRDVQIIEPARYDPEGKRIDE